MKRAHVGCTLQCRISRGDDTVVKKGSLPSINVSVEKRQGNKRVTRIVGVESFLVSAWWELKVVGADSVHDLLW